MSFNPWSMRNFVADRLHAALTLSGGNHVSDSPSSRNYVQAPHGSEKKIPHGALPSQG